MKQAPPSIIDEIKEYTLILLQVVGLIVLLIAPSLIGQKIISILGITEISHYLPQFLTLMGVILLYYTVMLIFHQKFINRIHANIYLKILMVSIILFWCVFDGFMVYTFQEVFYNNQERIIRRDIVWSDIDFVDLPADVIYPNSRAAFLGILSAGRFLLVVVIAYQLIVGEKTPEETPASAIKKKRKEKTIDDFKANVHPSVIKQYQNKDGEE